MRSSEKFILRWALPSEKQQYLKTMEDDQPVLTTKKREAAVFESKKAAMFHPANLVPKCGFEPVPLRMG